MLLDLKLTYIYKKTNTLVKIVSGKINLIGKSQEVCIQVVDVYNESNIFLCPVTQLESAK